MSEHDKRIIDQFKEMEKRMGRLLRGMTMPRMSSMQSGVWSPAADVYETETEILVLMDTAGIDPDKLTVVAERNGVTVTGSRKPPERGSIRCIHQLEIEHGCFKRGLTFSVAIDVAATVSRCRNGLLEIRLPKEKPTGRVAIKVA